MRSFDPAGALAEGGVPHVTLYRAVSAGEAVDIDGHGFRPSPNSLPGKLFATTLEDALRRGTALAKMAPPARIEPFLIVTIRLPAGFVTGLHHEPMLDGIGPAY